jgi:hypothetical protein
MFPVKYETGFISQKTIFFIVTAVKNLKSYTSSLINEELSKVLPHSTRQYLGHGVVQ